MAGVQQGDGCPGSHGVLSLGHQHSPVCRPPVPTGKFWRTVCAAARGPWPCPCQPSHRTRSLPPRSLRLSPPAMPTGQHRPPAGTKPALPTAPCCLPPSGPLTAGRSCFTSLGRSCHLVQPSFILHYCQEVINLLNTSGDCERSTHCATSASSLSIFVNFHPKVGKSFRVLSRGLCPAPQSCPDPPPCLPSHAAPRPRKGQHTGKPQLCLASPRPHTHESWPVPLVPRGKRVHAEGLGAMTFCWLLRLPESLHFQHLLSLPLLPPLAEEMRVVWKSSCIQSNFI